MQSLSDILTDRFYQWEERGRGWQPFPLPVQLEPQFAPFTGHHALPRATKDSGRYHTLISYILELLKFKPKEQVQPDECAIPGIGADVYETDTRIAVYTVTLPKNYEISAHEIEELLVMLTTVAEPVSFEIQATSTAITLQCSCRETDSQQVISLIKAYAPEVVLTKQATPLGLLWEDARTCAVDFGLRQEFMRPLRTLDKSSPDPYVGLFAAFDHVREGECAVYQVLFTAARHPWAESIMQAVTDGRGGSFFENAPDMVKLAQEKVSAPLFAVAVRVVGQAATGRRAYEIAERLTAALIQVTASQGNSLLPMSQEHYTTEDLINDILLRQSQRLGMLINSKELAALVHFPEEGVGGTKLMRDARKTKLAPIETRGHACVLGINRHLGIEHTVSVPDVLRLRHMHIIGATGTGKSTLLLSLIVQDMQAGNGLAVLDPHGDLIETILTHIPKGRIRDVILIDPADTEYPVGFNILSAHSEIEKDILSSDLVAAFKRLSSAWGDQMNSVFANAILALLENPKGGTLIDLRRFLVEKPFRDAYLKGVADTSIVYYWEHEYPLLKSNSIGSILTRLDTFLRPKLIRNMIAQRKGLDFEHILDTKKILLVKLSQGLMGEENSYLLGTFFVSKIYQAAMARQAKAKADRSDFYCYIDEFQNFSTPSMSHILSGARKYHLGLILAHQDMQQINKYDTELASSVVVNAGTRICFRLGDTDAKRFASGFASFTSEDLENLPTGEAIGRIGQPNMDFSLSIIPVQDVPEQEGKYIQEAVIAASRATYGTPKKEVEDSLAELGKSMPGVVAPPQPAPVPQPQQPPKVKEAPKPTKLTAQPPVKTKVHTEHRYIQTLIKRLAESRGYRASIEEVTPDGKGKVDVSLEKDGTRIACEVSVTTSDTWEGHNVEKCLAAGYLDVIVCSSDAKHLGRIREQLMKTLNDREQSKVHILLPEDIAAWLDARQIEATPKETVMKGYRIKVEYDDGPNKLKNKNQ